MSKNYIYLEDLLEELSAKGSLTTTRTGYSLVREFLENTMEEGDGFKVTILADDKIKISTY